MIKIFRLKIILLTLILVLVQVITGCSGNQDDTENPSDLSGFFNIIGSNTLTPLTAIWAEEFMLLHTNVNIAVSGPGSGAGIAALINSTTDICQASRQIKQREINLAEAKGVEPYEIQIASDALSVIVNPDNPVSELTIAQISAIYTGAITNWAELGGSDTPIVAIARDTNSGTHLFFKEQVVQMKGLPTEDKKLEYGNKVLFLPSTEEGVSEVAKNANAIFYPGLGYVTDEIKTLAIKKTADSMGVFPSIETSLDGTYSIARPLLYYTNGVPTGIPNAFIDYCLSDEGQAIVKGIGFVPLK
ncbi:MAG: phosphate ABC transporter substrate-binding protein [Dehalococcoidales bacterium]|nr:phosphate ABC transporter substrate-binding protein [Dehalococcoidales bacterium]